MEQITTGRGQRKQLPVEGRFPEAKNLAPIVTEKSLSGEVEGAAPTPGYMSFESTDYFTARYIPQSKSASSAALVITGDGQRVTALRGVVR